MHTYNMTYIHAYRHTCIHIMSYLLNSGIISQEKCTVATLELGQDVPIGSSCLERQLYVAMPLLAQCTVWVRLCTSSLWSDMAKGVRFSHGCKSCIDNIWHHVWGPVYAPHIKRTASADHTHLFAQQGQPNYWLKCCYIQFQPDKNSNEFPTFQCNNLSNRITCTTHWHVICRKKGWNTGWKLFVG